VVENISEKAKEILGVDCRSIVTVVHNQDSNMEANEGSVWVGEH